MLEEEEGSNNSVADPDYENIRIRILVSRDSEYEKLRIRI